MRTLLFCTALSLAPAQTTKVEVAEVEDPQTLNFTAFTTSHQPSVHKYELGGVTPTGKFYLIIRKDGKWIEKPCSRRALIRAVERSDMEIGMKTLVLRALGKPAGIIIYAPMWRKP